MVRDRQQGQDKADKEARFPPATIARLEFRASPPQVFPFGAFKTLRKFIYGPSSARARTTPSTMMAFAMASWAGAGAGGIQS